MRPICLALLASVLLAGCVQNRQFADVEFTPPAGDYRLLVMRPDVTVGSVTTGGMVEPRADWTETARQKQELEFYRGLVVRQYGSGALRVQELRIRPEEEERRYLVLITLVQAATRDTIANGTVTFSVEGRQGEETVTLPLPEIEVDKRKQFPFSLRFFQQIEVPIELPLDFRPERLHVEYRLGRNPEPTKQTFDWRVEAAAAPAL